MGCLHLPGLDFRLWRRKKSTPTPTPAPESAEVETTANGKANRRSLPHFIGTLAFERKKRDSREISKRDSGKSGLSDVTFVDDEENAKRASRLSTAKVKLSLDLKDKDELVEGLRYRGPSVRRRDTVDTLETPISPTTLSPDSPQEEEHLPKWKEEGVEDIEEEKPQEDPEKSEKKALEEEDSLKCKEEMVDDLEAEKRRLKALREEQERVDFFQMM